MEPEWPFQSESHEVENSLDDRERHLMHIIMRQLPHRVNAPCLYLTARHGMSAPVL